MKTEEKEHYVDSKEMQRLIVEMYRDNSDVNDELGRMINDICSRRGTCSNFRDYPFLSDMCGDALIKMQEALIHRKYSPVSVINNPDKLLVDVDGKLEKFPFMEDKKKKLIPYQKGKFLVTMKPKLTDEELYEYDLIDRPCSCDMCGNKMHQDFPFCVFCHWSPDRDDDHTLHLLPESKRSYYEESFTFLEHIVKDCSDKGEEYYVINTTPKKALIPLLDSSGEYQLKENDPFSYFTTVASYAFINRIKKEKQMRDALERYQDQEFLKFEEDNPEIKRSKGLEDEEDHLWDAI